jgi:RNA polymerase sigma-70 factor (ECF subfamily)
VRSLLQRARSAIAGALPDQDRVVAPPDLDSETLRRYLAALESGDANQLAELLRADVTYEMPPIAGWFNGRAAVLDHHNRRVFPRPHMARPTSANGYPALAMYTSDDGRCFRAHSIHLVEQAAGSITRIVAFLDTGLFPAFGLTATLPERPAK